MWPISAISTPCDRDARHETYVFLAFRPHLCQQEHVPGAGDCIQLVPFIAHPISGLAIWYFRIPPPRETVVDYGPLKVIVAASGREGFGRWVTVERDVVADYRRVFGKEPPARPLSITIWSDSDNTKDYAVVDFDDFELLPAAAAVR